jgi:hypothetical protein
VANGRNRGGKSKARREADTYRHPEAESPLRPEVGTQPQFKQRKTASHLPIRFVARAQTRPGRAESCSRRRRGADPRNPRSEVAGGRQGRSGEHGQIEVKVIDDRGNERMVVKDLK